MHELSDAVVAEGKANGLDVRRVILPSQEHWKGRLLIIENRPCQIVRTRYAITNPAASQALSIHLYLPRTHWPDFVIYVARQDSTTLGFYVVPRGILSKDTAWSPDSLAKYRDAWNLLRTAASPANTERRFAAENWQLRHALDSAESAGLETALIRLAHRKFGRTFVQTRILIEGRRCSLHSFSRLNCDPASPEHDYVSLRKPKSDWAEFQLYVLKGPERTVYIIPRGVLKADTSVSIGNEKVALFKDNWQLLKQDATHSVADLPSLHWLPKVAPPHEAPIAVRETIKAAESQGLIVKCLPLPTEFQLYISEKQCQVMRIQPMISRTGHTFIPLNLPRSPWAAFLIYFVWSNTTTARGDFYIVPRDKVRRRTCLSPVTSWLREYKGAWHLLRASQRSLMQLGEARAEPISSKGGFEHST